MSKNQILLIAHAPMCDAFMSTVQHIFGRLPPYLECIAVQPDDTEIQIPSFKCKDKSYIPKGFGPTSRRQGSNNRSLQLVNEDCEDRSQHPCRSKDKGYIVLTDLPGSTPANLSLRLLEQYPRNMRVVTGVNLPMLLRVINYCDVDDLDVLVEKALSGGKDSMQVFSSQTKDYSQ